MPPARPPARPPRHATRDAVDAAGAPALGDLALRGCLRRSPTARERLADLLYQRLHPAMAALGLLFLVLVLAQSAAAEGSLLHVLLLAATWAVWGAFAVEYVLRLVIAPSTSDFLRRTWWQLLLLLVPFLTMIRALLVLRMARPTRVALAALRGSRSARASLTGRTAWIGVVTAIVIFAAADILYRTGSITPYRQALHAAALAAINGEPTAGADGVAQIVDVALALYAVVVFATLAGILGAYFVERRQEQQALGAGQPPGMAASPGHDLERPVSDRARPDPGHH